MRNICGNKKIFRIALHFFLFVVASIAFSVSAFADPISYFDMSAQHSNNIKPFIHWTSMMTRYDSQKKIPDSLCGKVRFHPCVIKEWKQMVASLGGAPFAQQLATVNDWANQHPYIMDQLNWGIDNYWETPYEFMEVSGNCKDYAIAKYYSLRALGIPESRLRIIVVQDLNLNGVIHAVLGVDDGDQMLILDNQAQQVIPALKIYHYRPLYGINESSWWAYFPNH